MIGLEGQRNIRKDPQNLIPHIPRTETGDSIVEKSCIPFRLDIAHCLNSFNIHFSSWSSKRKVENVISSLQSFHFKNNGICRYCLESNPRELLVGFRSIRFSSPVFKPHILLLVGNVLGLPAAAFDIL